MSHIFKIVKENVTEAPLEYGKDTESINESLEVRIIVRSLHYPQLLTHFKKLKKDETFMLRMLSQLHILQQKTQSQSECESQFWEMIRTKGDDLKDTDYELGIFFFSEVLTDCQIGIDYTYSYI